MADAAQPLAVAEWDPWSGGGAPFVRGAREGGVGAHVGSRTTAASARGPREPTAQPSLQALL